MEEFQETLIRQNFTVISSEIFTDDPQSHLQEFKVIMNEGPENNCL